MLELRGIRTAMKDASCSTREFTVPTRNVAVVGHNGAGKSTLLRLLALLETPTRRPGAWNGAVVPRRPPASLRRRVTAGRARPILFRARYERISNTVFRSGTWDATRPMASSGVWWTASDCSRCSRGRRHELSMAKPRVAVARALACGPASCSDEPRARPTARRRARCTVPSRPSEPASVRRSSLPPAEDATLCDDIRALGNGRLSPVTPETCFASSLPAGDGVKTARVGSIELVVMTDRTGPVVSRSAHRHLRSREPAPSSAATFSGVA